MSGIGVIILPAIALIITMGIFVYQLRLYLLARRKNKKPNIPNFNIGSLPTPVPITPKPKHTEKKGTVPSKSSTRFFYYASAVVGVSLIIVMFATLSDEPFTFIPRASTPSPGISPSVQPTAQPTDLAGGPSPSSMPINYGTSPRVSRSPNPSLTPSVSPSPLPTKKAAVKPSTSPSPVKPSATPTTTPRPSLTPVISPSPSLGISPTSSAQSTPTPKIIAYVPGITTNITVTPSVAVGGGAKTTKSPTKAIKVSPTDQTTEIPKSGLINPSLFLLLAGGFILLVGFLF